ncbi:MAG: hypothetical protein PHW60_07270 [Kiritimatiellae bacterium]|nr:hypothetical protein [Kiritimatiellia bacterium]
MNRQELERKSSALTLSDMEIFVFPELIYSLLLANLMSPCIWRWRDEPWFAGLAAMTPYRRIVRVKQYIMDHYAFNLDLDTWGLTTKQRELSRFSDFIDAATLKQSNALFGYEGDKYYFDIDIRKHFGLDKYAGDVIPYWKTETVEAMNAFRYRENYAGGAGECVSLAVLYAAALFIVARVPLKDIFLMATPLHSQNFVDTGEGVLTNNRRLVTKTMWYNGTALSAQARRALENERVTLVAHETGHVHILFPEATIQPQAYERFAERLRRFLQTGLTDEMLGNYIRHRRDIQKCFQIRYAIHGVARYIGAERAFAYEQDSAFKVTDATRDKLLSEIETEYFSCERLPDGIVLNDLEDYLRAQKVDLNNAADVEALRKQFSCGCLNAALAIEGLIRFCRTVPRIPDIREKTVRLVQAPLGITLDMDREAVIARLEAIRPQNAVADLAFYAYRDLTRTEPEPFLRAAVERNPVSVAGAAALTEEQVVERVTAMPDESIYDEPGRLAQPDEVWNYGRGDGVERAILLANILHARTPDKKIAVEVASASAKLIVNGREIEFKSAKQLKQQVWPLA